MTNLCNLSPNERMSHFTETGILVNKIVSSKNVAPYFLAQSRSFACIWIIWVEADGGGERKLRTHLSTADENLSWEPLWGLSGLSGDDAPKSYLSPMLIYRQPPPQRLLFLQTRSLGARWALTSGWWRVYCKTGWQSNWNINIVTMITILHSSPYSIQLSSQDWN